MTTSLPAVKPGEMLAAALALAAQGHYVHPLEVGGKVATLKAWPEKASTDPDVIKRMWRDSTLQNIGIATGASNLYVIDVDSKDGKVGAETFGELLMEHDFVPTFTVRTYSGGIHYYYRMPAGLALPNTAGVKGLGKDIDTRGVGGYVVAPGSRVNGAAYEVIKDVPIAELPDWVIEMVRKPERIAQAKGGVMAATNEVIARVQQLADELENAPEGEGNHTAAKVAYMAGQYVGAEQVDSDSVIGILLDAIAGWNYRRPQDFNTMVNTIERQVYAGEANPREWKARRVVEESEESPAVEEQKSEENDTDEQKAKPANEWATESGQAEFLLKHLPNLRYADGVGWFEWDGKRFAPVTENHVATAVNTFYMKQFRLYVKRYMEAMKDEDNVTARSYKGFMAASKQAAIIKQMTRTIGFRVEANDLDARPDLLNCQNGVVKLSTGEIRPHDKKFLMTKIAAGSYIPGFKHDDWELAKTALDVETVDFMQARFGQALTGLLPESDDMIVMGGVGSNGKSAWTTDGLLMAIGDYAQMMKADLIASGKRTPGAADEDRVALRGVRLAMIEELPEGRSLNVTAIKNYVGTSTITARALFEHNITFDASHSLFITTNYVPTVAETDEGTWRRLCYVPFDVEFKADPQGPNERQGDIGLKPRLKAGKDGQHDAMLTWAIEGSIRYYADPTIIDSAHRPEKVVESTTAWRKSADRLLSYFEERLEPAPGHYVTRTDLFDDYSTWLAMGGHTKWTQETFHARFGKHRSARAAGVTTGQIRSAGNEQHISRPQVSPVPYTFNSNEKPLPARPMVYKGLRFRTDI